MNMTSDAKLMFLSSLNLKTYNSSIYGGNTDDLALKLILPASAQDCPTGWTKRIGFDDCYLVVSTQRTSWDEAREACHELDGDLVSIDQPGEDVSKYKLYSKHFTYSMKS